MEESYIVEECPLYVEDRRKIESGRGDDSYDFA